MSSETPQVETPTRTSPSDARIQEVVETLLAPLVETDGGRIELVRRDGDIVEIAFHGACRGCPGQPMTVRGVVLPALQVVAPEIRDVRVVSARRR